MYIRLIGFSETFESKLCKQTLGSVNRHYKTLSFINVSDWIMLSQSKNLWILQVACLNLDLVNDVPKVFQYPQGSISQSMFRKMLARVPRTISTTL